MTHSGTPGEFENSFPFTISDRGSLQSRINILSRRRNIHRRGTNIRRKRFKYLKLIVYHHQVRSGSEPGHGVGVVVEAEVLGQVDREGERLLSQDARLGLGRSGDGDDDDDDINNDDDDDNVDDDDDDNYSYGLCSVSFNGLFYLSMIFTEFCSGNLAFEDSDSKKGRTPEILLLCKTR